LPDSSWYLSVKVDRAELLAPGRRQAITFGVLTLVLLALAAGVVRFWWRAELAAVERRARALEEQALRGRFDALWSQANDIVLVVDPGGRMVEANQRALGAYGYERDELLRLRIEDLRAEETRGQASGQLAQVLGEGSFRFETVHRRKDGTTFPVEVSAARASGPPDGPLVLSVIRDISERHAAASARERAEVERRRLHAELVFADRLASIGTLAAGVAHEINNPLAYVLGNLEHLVRRSGPRAVEDAELVEVLREALYGARRIAEIVRGLRVFARRDGDATPGPVDVAKAVTSAARMVEAQARPRARLVTDLAETPPVLGKEHEVSQIVLNLAINAIQAVPEGRPADNEVRISTRVARDGGVELAVRDTGAGIAPELLERIYEPFFTTKGVGEGSGLGLSICHGIVERMGGTIVAESTVGRGTTFTVRMPSAPLEPGRPPRSP
jgi:PAS domain S-box-containing protein